MSKPKHQKHAAEWAEAQRACRLDLATLRMAQEMGMNPRKLMKNRPNPSEPWKGPVREWIRDLYARRHGQRPPALGDQDRADVLP